jgi:hypothetical protein
MLHAADAAAGWLEWRVCFAATCASEIYNWILALIALFGMRRKVRRPRSDININGTPYGIFAALKLLKFQQF